MRHEETAGGKVRLAFGITEPDRQAVVARAEEIRAAVNEAYRVSFGFGYEMSKQTSEAVASAEMAARPLIPVTKAEWDERCRAVDPYWHQDGLTRLADGVGTRRVQPDGTVAYSGSPEMQARMRAADEDSARRRQVSGFAGQIQ